jgi:hypothetical protein
VLRHRSCTWENNVRKEGFIFAQSGSLGSAVLESQWGRTSLGEHVVWQSGSLHKEQEAEWEEGARIISSPKDMATVTYFLQLGPTSEGFHNFPKMPADYKPTSGSILWWSQRPQDVITSLKPIAGDQTFNTQAVGGIPYILTTTEHINDFFYCLANALTLSGLQQKICITFFSSLLE